MREINIQYPTNVVIETTAHCQLKCSMCGRRSLTRKLGNMKPELVCDILDQLVKFNLNIRVWYCFLGEPLIIKKKLPDYIRYGKKIGLKNLLINTNGLLLDEKTTDQLIEAGLTEIYIGVDAFTKETYDKIRIGGNFEQLNRNIDYLLKIKPNDFQVTIQFTEIEQNRHEKQKFIDYWQERKARIFIKKEVSWIDIRKNVVYQSIDRYPCPWILDTLGIYWNGDIPFCVNDWNGKTVFTNLNEKSIQDCWKQQINQFARHHISREWNQMPEICKICNDWTGKNQRHINYV